MASTAIVFAPAGISVDTLSQAALPTALALGKVGLALVIVGFFAATFGAALETSLSAGYTVAQFFGWQWGKLVAPREASPVPPGHAGLDRRWPPSSSSPRSIR